MRIFVASSDQTFKLALLLLLESEPGMVVVGMSDRLESLPIVVGSTQPDVLLLDNGISRHSTAELVSTMRRSAGPLKIIVFLTTTQAASEYIEGGADAVISKDSPADVVLPMLRRLRQPKRDVFAPPR